jgi:hypothetical protein
MRRTKFPGDLRKKIAMSQAALVCQMSAADVETWRFCDCSKKKITLVDYPGGGIGVDLQPGSAAAFSCSTG